MTTASRDEFSQAVKRALAHRVRLLCSNPSCRAPTAGPQKDPSKAVSVGVAAHITGASPGGPRFDSKMTERERRGASNGIWLCQNCAKLIDSDPQAYTVRLLAGWKAVAEEEARIQIGKSDSKSRMRSVKEAVTDLQRDHKMRDDLHRDLLKTPKERMELPRPTRRVSKFAHSEIIVHRVDDKTYPNIDDSPGISGWFKLEILDFYHGGLECILGIECALLDTETRAWSLISYEQSQSSFAGRFTKSNIFITGKIPWRNILYYDMRGDEYYPQPHLYCTFADSGEPYEGRGYSLVGGGEKYEWELRPDDRADVEVLLALAGTRDGN